MNNKYQYKPEIQMEKSVYNADRVNTTLLPGVCGIVTTKYGAQ